jgi:hypothetical protein
MHLHDVYVIPICVQSYKIEVRVAHLNLVGLNANWYKVKVNEVGLLLVPLPSVWLLAMSYFVAFDDDGAIGR